MEKSICKLCGKNSELLISHIIPRFVYKWIKDTSGSGFIRFGENPNQRSQDGIKLPWLCEDCEKLLNTWETEFANKIFHPLNNGKDEAIIYDKWFNLFCVSLSWRVLNLYIDKNHLKEYPPAVQETIAIAIEKWKGYLLGQSNTLGQFEMFFFPMKPVRSIDGCSLEDIPPNLNVYMLRSIDMDVAYNEEYSFVYIKLGPFIIVGFVEFPLTDDWTKPRVHSDSGEISPSDHNMPKELFDFIIYKAKRAMAIRERISEQQKEKINKTFKKDLDKLAESNSLEALEYDILLFGKEKVFKEEN